MKAISFIIAVPVVLGMIVGITAMGIGMAAFAAVEDLFSKRVVP